MMRFSLGVTSVERNEYIRGTAEVRRLRDVVYIVFYVYIVVDMAARVLL